MTRNHTPLVEPRSLLKLIDLPPQDFSDVLEYVFRIGAVEDNGTYVSVDGRLPPDPMTAKCFFFIQRSLSMSVESASAPLTAAGPQGSRVSFTH